MDKLKLQTVYVPVAADKDTEYILSTNMHPGLRGLAELDNRIVLTKQELGQTILDAIVMASEGMPMSIEGKNQLVNQFLKAKGIVL